MKNYWPHALATFWLLSLASSVPAYLWVGKSAHATEMNCAGTKDIEVFCGLVGPEDIVKVPGTRGLILSEFHYGDDPGAGRLVFFDQASGANRTLYPIKKRDSKVPASSGCDDGADRFVPHGIDLGPKNNGSYSLFVVNHGRADSVHQFQVTVSSSNNIEVTWVSCIQMPDDARLNDVAALPDGGFVTTNNSSKGSGIDEWRPGKGLRRVMTFKERPQQGPNGIATSPDGKIIYLNAASRIFKIAIETGDIIGQSAVFEHLDNSTWSEQGQLLVASLQLPPGLASQCNTAGTAFCPASFRILSVDPGTLQAVTIFSHDGGTTFGAATVALQDGSYIYLGSFAGNRIARIRLPSTQQK